MSTILIILLSLMAVANIIFLLYVESYRKKIDREIEVAAGCVMFITAKAITATYSIYGIIEQSSLPESEKEDILKKISKSFDFVELKKAEE